MNGFMLLRERMLYMYAADAVVVARADVDAMSSAENRKRLEELSMWLMEWRVEEVLA